MNITYHISEHYRRCEVWVRSPIGRRQSRLICTPNAGLTEQERYVIVAAFIAKFGVEAPEYQS